MKVFNSTVNSVEEQVSKLERRSKENILNKHVKKKKALKEGWEPNQSDHIANVWNNLTEKDAGKRCQPK